MKTIYKYTLQVADQQTLQIPHGYSLLTAQMQNGEICLWAEVETNNITEPVEVRVVGTGHPIDDIYGQSVQYVGTVQPSDGLVFHVYAK